MVGKKLNGELADCQHKVSKKRYFTIGSNILYLVLDWDSSGWINRENIDVKHR